MKRLLLGLIRVYQLVLSPVLGANCRHEPTCSRYSFEAIERFGVFKGLWLTVNRVRKCHPWGTWGHDPVPPDPKAQNEAGKTKPASSAKHASQKKTPNTE